MAKKDRKEKLVYESLFDGISKSLREIVAFIKKSLNYNNVSIQEVYFIIKSPKHKKNFVSDDQVPAKYSLTAEGLAYYKQNE